MVFLKKYLMFFSLVITIIFIMYLIIINKNPKEVILVGKLISINTNIEYNFDAVKSKGKIQTSIKNTGIVTCINEETNEFVSLGHPIQLKENENIINEICYEANYVGINKPKKNMTGSIKSIVNNNKQYGEVKKNTTYGIYGNTLKEEINCENKIKIASKYNVRYGKAEIMLNLENDKVEKYEVIVVGINYFDKNQNINIKITDAKLINLAGGIVKGMSGAPLIQNGRLIGAVNFVSESNPKDAYAIFADKLF